MGRWLLYIKSQLYYINFIYTNIVGPIQCSADTHVHVHTCSITLPNSPRLYRHSSVNTLHATDIFQNKQNLIVYKY